jgi:aminobenzoyl-glutamate transport protein
MTITPAEDNQTEAPQGRPPRRGVLDWIEWFGNRLPEPVLLFALLCAFVIALSGIGAWAEWSIQPVQPRMAMITETGDGGASGPQVKLRADGHPEIELVATGQPVTPRSLLNADGVYWMLSSMLRNFTTLPAIGLIFVAILGIGLAEKFGFFSALMRALAFLTPRAWLTPMIIFIGANASVASDAGYVILPPLAAALFVAVGRHPLAGLAAAFTGVAGGFGAGFFPSGGDGALAGFAQDAAHVIDPNYSVSILHNIYFKTGSAILVTLVGWFVTDRIVEPRLQRLGGAALPAADGLAPSLETMALTVGEKRALGISLSTMLVVLALFAGLIYVPGMPLHGTGLPTLPDGRAIVHQPVKVVPPQALEGLTADDILVREPLAIVEGAGRARLVEPPGNRWAHVIVPIIFFAFLVPGLVYGRLTGALRTQKDVVEGFHSGVRTIVPVLTIAFFMGQFVNYFAYTRLDRMLAYGGGSLLVQADLPVPLLLALFVLLVVIGDFAISGMLSKFGVLAPIVIPMFMMVGISPELTTAAYRIGDSVVNIVTPLNSYLLIILVVLQKYKPDAGFGNLVSLMLPYSVALGISWTVFLLAWYMLGFGLGPGAPLDYIPR